MPIQEGSIAITATGAAQQVNTTSLRGAAALLYEAVTGNSGNGVLWGFSATTANMPLPIGLPLVSNGVANEVDLAAIYVKGTAGDVVNWKLHQTT